MVIAFTDGNMSLIPNLLKVYHNRHQFDSEWQMKWEKADSLREDEVNS